MTYALLIILPMVFVWFVVLLDVKVRQDLSPQGRAAWIVVVTLLWPTMILYLLMRPVQGRLIRGTAVRRGFVDSRQELVAAVLDRRSGRLSQQEFSDLVAELRGSRE